MSGLAGEEFSGKTVEEATADGLRALGLRSEDAVIEIVNKGSRGLFGIGSEPAVVRIAVRGASSSVGSTSTAAQDAANRPVNAEDAGDEIDFAASSVELPTTVGEVAASDEDVLESTIVEEVVMSASAKAEKSARADSAEMDAEVAAMGSEMLGEIVRLMGFDCTVSAEWRDADDITEERHLLLSVRGHEASGLIGRRGETLENIQYLLRLMVNQRMHRWLNIIVDIEEYRARRVEHLTHLAQRMAQQAVDSGRSQALEPMTPNERRIVHLVLRDDGRVFTESTGEGERRKVVIFPNR